MGSSGHIALYPELVESLKHTIEEFLEDVGEERLENPYTDRRAKEEVLIAYCSLKEDQEAYRDLHTGI